MSHGIRLDQNQKPKNFYLLEVSFKNDKKHKSAQQKDWLTISQEKVYGDFKRLHSYIIETFQNEIREYERMENIMQEEEENRESGAVFLNTPVGTETEDKDVDVQQ